MDINEAGGENVDYIYVAQEQDWLALAETVTKEKLHAS
jgi:hypothetical protein